jgi:hypothetical protein
MKKDYKMTVLYSQDNPVHPSRKIRTTTVEMNDIWKYRNKVLSFFFKVRNRKNKWLSLRVNYQVFEKFSEGVCRSVGIDFSTELDPGDRMIYYSVSFRTDGSESRMRVMTEDDRVDLTV